MQRVQQEQQRAVGASLSSDHAQSMCPFQFRIRRWTGRILWPAADGRVKNW